SWQKPFAAVSEWLDRTFDISLGSLRFRPGEEAMFVPPDTANVVMAQGIGPSGGGAWLVLTAPTPEKLQSGAATLARNANWERLSGSLTLFGIGDTPMDSRPVTRVDFLPTQPF